MTTTTSAQGIPPHLTERQLGELLNQCRLPEWLSVQNVLKLWFPETPPTGLARGVHSDIRAQLYRAIEAGELGQCFGAAPEPTQPKKSARQSAGARPFYGFDYKSEGSREWQERGFHRHGESEHQGSVALPPSGTSTASPRQIIRISSTQMRAWLESNSELLARIPDDCPLITWCAFPLSRISGGKHRDAPPAKIGRNPAKLRSILRGFDSEAEIPNSQYEDRDALKRSIRKELLATGWDNSTAADKLHRRLEDAATPVSRKTILSVLREVTDTGK